MEQNRLIESFIANNLSEDDRQALVQCIKNDADLLRKIIKYRRALSLLKVENSIKIFGSIYNNRVLHATQHNKHTGARTKKTNRTPLPAPLLKQRMPRN